MEENVASGGFGEKVRDAMARFKDGEGYLQVALPDEYVEHGNVELLKKEVGIDPETVTERIIKEMESRS